MRGQKEQVCLELVKNHIFTKDGKTVRNPFTQKTYQEASDEEFEEDWRFFMDSNCHKNFFGMFEEDDKIIVQALRKAKPNINLNDFPDFVFEKGFIEHFQISSSKVTRKGAEHIKK